MEQIQIRQPKMPVAQSFIQILGTFLAKLFNFIAVYFSHIKNSLFNWGIAKTVGNTRFSLKKSKLICHSKKCQSVIKLRI
jgi:type IV secretory pathway TraG/TraD family ATPase VirD4